MKASTHRTRAAADEASEHVALTGWKKGEEPGQLIRREWLVTNGLGGYASASLAGAATRRYHGLLIAALPTPLGRHVMLNHLEEWVRFDGSAYRLSGDESTGDVLQLPELDLLEAFRLEHGLPVWEFRGRGMHLTRRLMMPYRQNATIVAYHLHAGSSPVELTLSPSVHFRPHEQSVTLPLSAQYSHAFEGTTLTIRQEGELPPLRITLDGASASFESQERSVPELLYRVEQSRGYDHAGSLWNPGTLRVALKPGQTLHVRCTTDDAPVSSSDDAFEAEYARRDALLAQASVDSERETIADLVFAADQFIIVPERKRALRVADATAAEPRTIIAGYHWFTDWGRDTMISLEGLTLATGRTSEAASILRTFAQYVRDGLIPNMFPEGENEGLYHTADATLWFFQAVERYVAVTQDDELLRDLIPVFDDIIDHHVRGTRFGIGVDASDSLLRQGAEGYQLTWMDAKVDGWVVTPRRGKAVEINALFYNAVRLLESWHRKAGNAQRADGLRSLADRNGESFNRRFWYEEGGYLYDVVDGEEGRDDAALRPNQIFSIALTHPVLDRGRWEAVVDAVARELLTPVGLRSLARSHPEYKPVYDGDLRTRDAAYHQGTVWSWLIGPFIDAYLKTHPDGREEARAMLQGLEAHLADAGVGSISEVFDAESPYEPRGCIAQAWGVAELLRCLRRV